MEKYGLIGYPLSHSFSRDFFNEKFKSEGIDAEYLNFEIPSIDRLPETLTANPDLRGFNVTIPYKEKIISYLDELSEEADHIGAVNVVKISQRKGKTFLKGYNSDVIGFMRSIEPLLDSNRRRALVLGTGGASKAVTYALHRLGVDILMVSRNPKEGMISYNQLTPEIVNSHKIIINCTPVGMYPHSDECPQIPYQAVEFGHLLYDLIYNPDETLFLKQGKQQGAETKNGLEMLLLQAYASWDFWHND